MHFTPSSASNTCSQLGEGLLRTGEHSSTKTEGQSSFDVYTRDKHEYIYDELLAWPACIKNKGTMF